MGDLQHIFSRLEHSIRSMCRKFYYASAGKKEKTNEDHREESEDLFTFMNVETMRNALSSSESKEEDRRPLLYVYRYLFFQTIESMLRDSTQAIEQLENKLEVAWEGRSVPLSRARSLIWTETEDEKRHELCQRVNAMETVLHPLREERFLRLQEQAKQQGFPHYRALYEKLSGIQLTALEEQMKDFLAKTDALYQKAFATYIPKGTDGKGVERHHLYPVLSGRKYDLYFREIELLPTLEDTLYGLGINILQQASIVMDVEKRVNKSSCCCSPLLIPKEIYLVIYPKGGLSQYCEILHEAGRAEYFAHIREDLPWMYKLLGDPSLPHAYGYVLQDLITNKDWTEHHLDMDEAVRTEFYEYSLFRKLYRWRKYAGMFLYELDLYAAQSLEGMAERYVQMMSRATGAVYTKETYLEDILHPFASARLLRSWMFASQLCSRLQTQYGNRWFRDQQAGRELKQMWSFGATYTIEEWCEKLNIPLDTSNFLKDIQDVWGSANEHPSV
ncbi:hypothetical protein DNHGIG_13050 [Collibacillus ludicampi]|uniref:Uncharacterized protein n=1 Tax=Collibacillus ludicampi TaxID=2771369 RepID=A0AAV4LD76_9BACL|nr:hypothetical protein [Collibacillus ludicampi]GIM45756.1 hypothetical protein DNHGIG_13050 [Collibacillus ludicampi]